MRFVKTVIMAGGSRPLAISEPSIRILNDSENRGKCTSAAVEVSKNLQKLMLQMKGEVMTEDGNGVDYEALKSSKLFSQYKEQAALLRDLDIGSLGEDEKKAFFINIYNALTIHGLAECDTLPTSVLNVQLFWKVTAYKIGGHVYSLDDMEHGILRANSPHPSSKTPPFAANDPRVKFLAGKKDPRIHFALVCGAKSCPAINVYTAKNLDYALDAATRNFCQQEIRVFEQCQEVHVSRIFQWYRCDFGENDVEAVRWTIPFLEDVTGQTLRKMLKKLEEQGMVGIHYTEYDWNLNKV